MPRKKNPTVVEVAPVAEIVPAPEQVEVEEPKQIALEDLQTGYVVGLTEDNKFVFEVIGTEKRLAELLGVHEHATRQVDKAYRDSNMQGDRLVHEVGLAVGSLNKKFEELLKALNVSVADDTTVENVTE